MLWLWAAASAREGELRVILEQRQNWLPAPMEDFRFSARFYGPKAPLIDGSYPMPRPVRVESCFSTYPQPRPHPRRHN
jgi:hypothetical protein